MIGPLPLAPILQRVQDGTRARLVSHAADLATALRQKPRALPAAYVVRQERARPSAGASGGVLVQEMAVDVIVVLYVQHHAEGASGAKAAAEMDAFAGEVRGQLLNWAPDPGADPLSMNASRDEYFVGGALCSQELFRSRYRIEVRP